MKPISRRQVVVSTGKFLGIMIAGRTLAGPIALKNEFPVSFDHGVASGDPTAEGFLLWTRITPDIGSSALVEVGWEVAIAADFSEGSLVKSGRVATLTERDFTLKVDVSGLESGRSYYYRFNAGSDRTSPVGLAKTLATGSLEKVTFGVVSCSHFGAGYFHVYRMVAENVDIDFALHLGDYIYEFGMGGYGTEHAEAIGRILEPVHEILTLEDYRQRYRQYRRDPDLQLLHAQKTMICIWDDHEFANDAYKDGAANHNPGEGSFQDRVAAAKQAYFEWMPIRGQTSTEIFRSFRFGDLCQLTMLDTRLHGRMKQLALADYRQGERFDWERLLADVHSPERTLLGKDQRDWLLAEIAANPCRWLVIGGQVLMARMEGPEWLIEQILKRTIKAQDESLPSNQGPKVPYNLDAWDGYQAERDLLLEAVANQGGQVIHIAGDSHNAWASEIATADGRPAIVEFATPSVTSPGAEEILKLSGGLSYQAFESILRKFVAGLKFANTNQRGYLTLTLKAEEALATWSFIKSPRDIITRPGRPSHTLKVDWQEPGRIS